MKDGKIKAYLAQKESERKMRDDREVKRYVAYFFSENKDFTVFCEIWARDLETAWKTAEEEFEDYKETYAKIEVPYADVGNIEDEYERTELEAKQERLKREFLLSCSMALVEK